MESTQAVTNHKGNNNNANVLKIDKPRKIQAQWNPEDPFKKPDYLRNASSKNDPYRYSSWMQDWAVISWTNDDCARWGPTEPCKTEDPPKIPKEERKIKKALSFIKNTIVKPKVEKRLVDILNHNIEGKKLIVENHSNLSKLGNDILFHIISMAHFRDVLALSQTSRFFYIYCDQDRLWKAIYEKTYGPYLFVPHFDNNEIILIENKPLNECNFDGRWKREMLVRNRIATKPKKKYSKSNVYINVSERITSHHNLSTDVSTENIAHVAVKLIFMIDRSHFPLRFRLGTSLHGPSKRVPFPNVIFHPLVLLENLSTACHAINPGWESFEVLKCTTTKVSLPLDPSRLIAIGIDCKSIIIDYPATIPFKVNLPIHEDQVPEVFFDKNGESSVKVLVIGNKLKFRSKNKVIPWRATIVFSRPYGWRADDNAEIKMTASASSFTDFKIRYFVASSVDDVTKWVRYQSISNFTYKLPSEPPK